VCAAAAPPDTQARVLAQLNQGSAVAGASLDDLVQTEALAPVQASLAQACTLRTQEGTCLYFPVRACNGVVAYLHAPLRIDAVDPRLFEVFCAHITAGFEKAFLEQKIADLAYRDPVLDLPNRNAFFEWAQTEVNAHTVLAQIDIDNFSDINTVLDLGFGDQVLLAVARRIQAHFPPPVRVARLGADIFGLLGDRQYVTPQAIAGVFAEPFNVGEHALRLSATTGLVVCQDESANGVMALKNSAIAVKQAKMLVRSKHLYFDPAQSSAARDRLLMLSNLRAAFSANRLFVVFQPFVELSTSRIVGAEALLRWRSETGDFIPPDRFIPLAEESGLMVPIGEWIMRTAFREQRRFQAACPGTRFRMAINVSHVQFREPDFVDTLRQAMHDSGIDPASVEIELTESVAIEDVRFIVETLLRVRHLGVSIAIDDFGTGYSSLSVVRELPVHRLKIDRSFVNNVEADPSIARLVIGLARQLSIETIAEGIETVAQREILQALGCDDGQGYLFARPLPAQGLLELLQATCGPAQ
jgi:predicted signal transduction protein with EAL and GGDEF domain